MSYASQLGTFSVTVKKRFFSLALPILLCSILSGICSWVIFGFFTDESGGGGPPPATPIQDDSPGSAALNALFYVGIAFIGATLIFLVFKYGKIGLLKALFAAAIAITSFFFIFLLTFAAPYYFAELIWGITVFRATTDWVLIGLGITLGLAYSSLTVLSMVYQKIPKPMPQIMAMLFAVLAGTFLATFLPMLASVFVMIGLSIYDIVSVFRGPIKKIAEISEERYMEQLNSDQKQKDEENNTEELTIRGTDAVYETYNELEEDKEELTGTIIDQKDSNRVADEEEFYYVNYIELGLGDLAFFGMLSSFALIRLGAFAAIAGFVGVIIGALGTIKLLEKVSMMPGLPLSVTLGLILAFAIWGILALAGYRGWGWVAPDWFSIPV